MLYGKLPVSERSTTGKWPDTDVSHLLKEIIDIDFLLFPPSFSKFVLLFFLFCFHLLFLLFLPGSSQKVELVSFNLLFSCPFPRSFLQKAEIEGDKFNFLRASISFSSCS